MARSVANKKEQLPVVIDFAADSLGGFDGLSQQDLAIPFFGILQKGSPQLDTWDDAKAGQIFNSVTEETFESITVVPCGYKREFVEWIPKDAGGGLVTSHPANSSTLQSAKRIDKKLFTQSGNQLVETAYHFVLVPGVNSLDKGLITMSSTQLKKNRRWNSLMLGIKMTNANGESFTPARYSHQYLLSTKLEKNDLGSWYGWDIQMIGPVEDSSLYTLAKDFANQVLAGEVNVSNPQPESGEDNEIPF